MEVLFFTEFSKRKNSTKQPDDSLGIVKNVTLKDTTDKVNPVFMLTGTDDYVYCKAWGMYYFVHRISYNIDGAQMVYCNIDVLATWKSEILNTRAFVILSTSDYSTLLTDTRVPMLADTDVTHELRQSELFYASSGEHFLLTCMNADQGLVTYILGYEDMYTLMQCLLTDDNIVESMSLRFGSAVESIIALRRMPIVPSKMYDYAGGAYTLMPVWLGAHDFTTDDGIPMQPNMKEDGHIEEFVEIPIPWHYTDYRKIEPYQYLSLALPFVGVVPLKASDFLDVNKICIRTDVDLRTGVIVYTIYSYLITEPVAVINAQCGADVPIASLQMSAGANYMGSAIELASAGAMLAHGAINPVSAGILIKGSVDALSAFLDRNAIISGSYSGGFPEYGINDYVAIVRWHPTREEPSNLANLYGRPCCKVLEISTLTGFVQTEGFKINISSLDVFKDMINSLMDTGVYFE